MWALTAAVICLSVTFSHADESAISTERELTDKVVLITGAAKGLGHAMVDQLLQNKVKVVIIVDINEEKGSEAETTYNEKYGAGKVDYQYGDVRTDMEDIYEYVSTKYGYVDVLILNAGVAYEYDIKNTMYTNTVSTAEWSMKYFNIMRKDCDGKGGTIIILASLAGYCRMPLLVAYSASKAANLLMAYNLGHNYTYRTSGVRVLALCPGLTYSDMTKGQMVTDDQIEIWEKFKAASSWQMPVDVAEATIEIFKSADSGTAWTVDGGVISETPQSRNITTSILDEL